MKTPAFYGHTPLKLGDKPLPGRLIVIEGTDGVGRSTQIGLLKEWLETEGFAVSDTGFRRSDLTGNGIDRAKRGHILDHLTLNLFYATDFWDRMERSILPALEAGMVILGDRYIFSIMARARVRGVPAHWLDDVLEFAMVPDQIYFLDVDVEHLLPRVMANRELDHWESGEDFLRSPTDTPVSCATKAPSSRSSVIWPTSTVSRPLTPGAASAKSSRIFKRASGQCWKI